jgi:hypothetical protein
MAGIVSLLILKLLVSIHYHLGIELNTLLEFLFCTGIKAELNSDTKSENIFPI